MYKAYRFLQNQSLRQTVSANGYNMDNGADIILLQRSRRMVLFDWHIELFSRSYYFHIACVQGEHFEIYQEEVKLLNSFQKNLL